MHSRIVVNLPVCHLPRSVGSCHIEVRRLYELEDFGALEGIRRFAEIPGNGRPASG